MTGTLLLRKTDEDENLRVISHYSSRPKLCYATYVPVRSTTVAKIRNNSTRSTPMFVLKKRLWYITLFINYGSSTIRINFFTLCTPTTTEMAILV